MNSTHNHRKATGVSFDGPFADQDRRSGDEFPYWTVCLIDDDGEAIGTVYTVHSYSKADALAQKIARDRHVELVMDASPA